MVSEIGPGCFFLPGPTEVDRAVLEAQVRPMIGHRGADMQALMERLQEGLKEVFRTERPVVVSTSSATGLMEAAVRNAGGAKQLALVNGAFSGRFSKIGEACGVEVESIEVEWGDVIDPARVRARLQQGGIDCVTMVHSETSTGTLSPLREIAEVVAEFEDVLLMVDGVTSVGGAAVETDRWGVDFVLTGSQKALALPPGLAFAVASERFVARAKETTAKGVYFDVLDFLKRLEKMETPTTPALSLLFALECQLDRIHREGMEARWQRHLDMAARTYTFIDEVKAEGVPLGILAAPDNRTPTVTCVTLGAPLEGPAVVAAMRSRGWVIGGGYGKLKPTSIRIGHMGDHTVEELDALLGELAVVLKEMCS